MSRIAYVNGVYVNHHSASVHIEDRGYQFSDGVYEVCEVYKGSLVDMQKHMARLKRSLTELRMSVPMDLDILGQIMQEVVKRNYVFYGMVYIQITRGVSPRKHEFPTADIKPAITITAKNVSRKPQEKAAQSGIRVVTTKDNRWDRPDIKSISLLPNVLAKQIAKDNQAYEAWFVDNQGYVTEGSSTNAWIIDKQGNLITRAENTGILSGITRRSLIDMAKKKGIKVIERHFTVEEAQSAREAFITAATTIIVPVTEIDGKVIGNGKPGEIARQLRLEFHNYVDIVN